MHQQEDLRILLYDLPDEIRHALHEVPGWVLDETGRALGPFDTRSSAASTGLWLPAVPSAILLAALDRLRSRSPFYGFSYTLSRLASGDTRAVIQWGSPIGRGVVADITHPNEITGCVQALVDSWFWEPEVHG